MIPPGFYGVRAANIFCSTTCEAKTKKIFVIAQCLECGEALYGYAGHAGRKKFCLGCMSKRRGRLFNEATGPFSEILIRYLEGDGKNHYANEVSLRSVRSGLMRFFQFVASCEVTALNDVKPGHVTRFIYHERERGLQTDKYISQISVFFRWVAKIVDPKICNPVITEWHVARQSAPLPRPYPESEITHMIKLLQKEPLLLCAFHIGLECGLRVGEVANVRLDDIDLNSQKLRVRLPTKNMRERLVPFHEGVRESVQGWLAVRDPLCHTDHLLHNKWRNKLNTVRLCVVFRDFFLREDPSLRFSFHRLRHTWACRLINNGIDPTVLMELGGWVSWQSMQFYLRLLQSTLDKSYSAAIENLRNRQQEEPESVMSMLDFVKSSKADPSTIVF